MTNNTNLTKTECPTFTPLKTGYQDVTDFVAMDTETTGLSKTSASIIQFSAVKYVNRQPVDEIDFYINPNNHKPLDPEITELTGITPEDIAKAKPFKEHFAVIDSWIHNDILVGHNFNFDLTMLASEYHRIGKTLPTVKYYDTLQLAHQLVPYLVEPGAYKLENIKDILPESETKNLTNHNSLNDTKMTGAIFNYLTNTPDITKKNLEILKQKSEPFQVKELEIADHSVTRYAGKIDSEPYIIYQINDIPGCVINSLVCGHWIDKNDIKQLLEKGYIANDHFLAHSGRTFAAHLILDDDNQLVFDFPKNYLVDNFDVQVEQRDGVSKYGRAYTMFTLYGHDIDKAIVFDHYLQHDFSTAELVKLANGDEVKLDDLISKNGHKFTGTVKIVDNQIKII